MRFLNPSDKTTAMDYSSALATAVAWLGNRYLLAMPAKRLTYLERCSANLSTAPSVPQRAGKGAVDRGGGFSRAHDRVRLIYLGARSS
jgi:hypothetical protein